MKDLDILRKIEQKYNISFVEYDKWEKNPEKTAKRSGRKRDDENNLANQQLYRIDNNENVYELYINSAKLKEIPLDIVELRYLQRLDLVFNSIETIPLELSQLNLHTIYLLGNKIRRIPHEIIFMRSLHNFVIDENLIEGIPPEVLNKGIDSIRNYVNSLNGQTKNLNEVKVILVGDGGSGKTSLQKLLINEAFDPQESQTHGINIKHLKLRPKGTNVIYRLWDFGGQEIMHATHQFFLSRRSIYIILLNAREEPNPEYWLNHVKSFGGDSPVIVVINKTDENPSYDVNRLFLKEKYPNIIDFVKVSCSNKEGIESVKNNLRNAVNDIKNLNVSWALSWFEVKKALENMKENFISYDQFTDLCQRNGIQDYSTQNTLVEYLNDLGIILHFKDFSLHDTHVLDPEWVTFAVYKIINSKQLATNRGVLNLSSIRAILNSSEESGRFKYPSSQLQYIIELMLKFELCYRVSKTEILIPDLLAVQEPRFKFDENEDILDVRLNYSFLPKSVMPRLIINLHSDIVDKLRWRTGLIVQDKNLESIAVIKADYDLKEISIVLSGTRKRDYLSIILFLIRRINKSFDGLDCKVNIPVNADGSVRISHSHLLTLESKNIKKYLPDGLDEEIDVQKVLGSVQSTRNMEEEIFSLLDKLVSQNDNKETIAQKANEIIQLEPNFFGIGVNINALVKRYLKK